MFNMVQAYSAHGLVADMERGLYISTQTAIPVGGVVYVRDSLTGLDDE